MDSTFEYDFRREIRTDSNDEEFSLFKSKSHYCRIDRNRFAWFCSENKEKVHACNRLVQVRTSWGETTSRGTRSNLCNPQSLFSEAVKCKLHWANIIFYWYQLRYVLVIFEIKGLATSTSTRPHFCILFAAITWTCSSRALFLIIVFWLVLEEGNAQLYNSDLSLFDDA